MKLISFSRFALVALFGVAAPLSVRAQTQVDLWSAAGGAWTLANQPNWTPGTGGVLNPDTASDSGADLIVTGATSGGLYDSFYYTFFSTPAFDLSTSNVLSGVKTVTLSFVSSSVFSESSATLSFNGLQSATAFSAAPTGQVEMGQSYVRYTWDWDVSALGTANAFSMEWTTPSAHTAYTEVALIQAVPEPHEYAVCVAALLGLLIVMRRRRVSLAA
ncbi:MAG TPA: hypothetical protein VIM61_03395 [Chthoniobacterales bacterium]|jgi:hypothetical protein